METVFHNSHFALFFGVERRRVTLERDVSDLARDHANYTASRIADHLSLLSGAEYIRHTTREPPTLYRRNTPLCDLWFNYKTLLAVFE